MNVVKLYKYTITTPEGGKVYGYEFEPFDELKLFSGYKGEDDGGKEYILPEGFELTTNMFNEKKVVKRLDEHSVIPVSIVEYNKLPAIDYLEFDLKNGRQKIFSMPLYKSDKCNEQNI